MHACRPCTIPQQWSRHVDDAMNMPCACTGADCACGRQLDPPAKWRPRALGPCATPSHFPPPTSTPTAGPGSACRPPGCHKPHRSTPPLATSGQLSRAQPHAAARTPRGPTQACQHTGQAPSTPRSHHPAALRQHQGREAPPRVPESCPHPTSRPHPQGRPHGQSRGCDGPYCRPREERAGGGTAPV